VDIANDLVVDFAIISSELIFLILTN